MQEIPQKYILGINRLQTNKTYIVSTYNISPRKQRYTLIKFKRLSKYWPFNDDERFYQYQEHKQLPQTSKYLII